MTREEARQIIATWLVSSKGPKGQHGYIEGWFDEEDVEAFRMAIEALKAQEYDEIVFDMNEFFSIVDDGKITVMRKGRGRVTVEHPAIRMETTIFPYGERRENE